MKPISPTAKIAILIVILLGVLLVYQFYTPLTVYETSEEGEEVGEEISYEQREIIIFWDPSGGDRVYAQHEGKIRQVIIHNETFDKGDKISCQVPSHQLPAGMDCYNATLISQDNELLSPETVSFDYIREENNGEYVRINDITLTSFHEPAPEDYFMLNFENNTSEILYLRKNETSINFTVGEEYNVVGVLQMWDKLEKYYYVRIIDIQES